MHNVTPKELETEADEFDEIEPDMAITIKLTSDDLISYITKVKVFKYR